MNYGMYLSAGGALANMHRQDVLANNLANMNTVAFKADSVHLQQRLPERLESTGAPGAFTDPSLMLERLGGGVFVDATRASLEQGEMMKTDQNLDVAFEGEGFFVVAEGLGADPTQRRLTRDGRFTLNERSELVMIATGMKVLDVENQPIRIDHTKQVRIDEQGSIVQDGRPVAQIQRSAAGARDLVKVGDNLFKHQEAPAQFAAAEGRLRQGYLEGSGVDPIMTLNAMISASKAAQSNLMMIQYHDHTLGQMFTTFGRVA